MPLPMPMSLPMPSSHHSYLHIPFCRQKCPYCKFALTPVFDAAKKRRYIAHLKKEIQDYFLSSWACEGSARCWDTADSSYRQNDRGTNTIYFGWGTPSVLSLDEVRELLELFPWRENIEVSFECNPEDITENYIEWLLCLGINRLSIGVQSLNNETLKAIHRSDRESILDALSCITDAMIPTQKNKDNNFEEREYNAIVSSFWVTASQPPSLNIDFILGLPFSKPWETLRDIRILHEQFPCITHTSVYMLEDGYYPASWKQDSIQENEMESEYTKICEYFNSIGWHHYEISNWSKGGYECRHNQSYWDHSEYRWFGLSATSFSGLNRSEKSASFAWYYRSEMSYEDLLDEEDLALEKIIYGIRTFSLPEGDFDRSILSTLQEKWYIQIENGKIVLTPTWIFRENTIISTLIDKMPP